MNCFPAFSYIFILITYIVLFSFLFQPKLENIILIFLFILTLIAGFNLIMDLKRNKMYLTFAPLEELFKNDGGLDLIKLLLFSPITTMLLFIVFIYVLINYINGQPDFNLNYVIFLSVLLFTTNALQMGATIQSINIAWVFAIPYILIILSILFVIIVIYNINANTTGKNDPIPLSKFDENGFLFDISMIITVSIIALFLTYFVLFYETENKTLQFQLYTIIPIIYGGSAYMTYLSSILLEKKFLQNKK
jgi:hypothetical protein